MFQDKFDPKFESNIFIFSPFRGKYTKGTPLSLPPNGYRWGMKFATQPLPLLNLNYNLKFTI